MSLIQKVVDAIEKLGRASYVELMPLFPNKTRNQIMDAIGNAKAAGYIYPLPKPSRKGHKGGIVAYYAVQMPIDDDTLEALPPRGEYAHVGRVNSVWQMGAA